MFRCLSISLFCAVVMFTIVNCYCIFDLIKKGFPGITEKCIQGATSLCGKYSRYEALHFCVKHYFMRHQDECFAFEYRPVTQPPSLRRHDGEASSSGSQS